MQSFHGAGNCRPCDASTPVGDAGPTSTAAGSESGLHSGHTPLPERQPWSTPLASSLTRVGRYHGRPMSHSMSLSKVYARPTSSNAAS